ncbi:MFS transporter [Telmatospirillum siberiense]|uniref:MFS transporter n=1 Tax=Telmatospirillum siberiense TaxID=382514 RepID=A0A2N3PVB6_9PROT|nr:MFS transporter [Telmatospirillum siberiense]PKU24339.1 MFS transporter [Telmatospirillum siberiense]
MSAAPYDCEKDVIRKVSLRLIPFLVFSYILCFVDRVNLGFAALTMNKEFGFSPTIFGWGAGILFVGYFFFGVPSNLGLNKYGARRWIAGIMILWGLVSASMVLIQGTASFFAVRFLLGAAEAGFFPGIILYLTFWFPAQYRGRIVSRFMFAQPIALTLGSAVSGWLLEMDGVMGVAGWKWLFILEGIPSSLVGVIALFYLTDLPFKAMWLKPEERAWLQGELDKERRSVESAGPKYSLWETMTNTRVLLLCLIYVCMVIGVYGVNMWLPQIVKSFGNAGAGQIGVVAAIPFFAASIGMLLIGMSSDKFQERKWHVTVSTLVAGCALVASAFTQQNQVLTILLLSISSIGMYGCMPIFWTIPPTFLTGTAVAAGIGFINAIGNLGGFLGPFLVGYIKESTGSFISGLLFMGGCTVVGSLLVYVVCKRAESSAANMAQAVEAKV